MPTTKTRIYNMACSDLLLNKQIIDTESDKNTNEVKALNTYWDDAFTSTLQELDIDSLSEPVTLELLANLDDTGPWCYVYKYPTKCAFFRRIVSGAATDTHMTAISKRVGMYNGQKAIFTNQYAAQAEIIPNDFPLEALSSSATFAIAHKLAYLTAPLLVGKGAKTLQDDIYKKYMIAVSEAQSTDSRENYNFDEPWIRSEFVAARLS